MIASFIADRAPTIEHNRDEAAEIWQHFEIRTQPAMVLVSSSGEVEVLALSQGRTGLLWRLQELV